MMFVCILIPVILFGFRMTQYMVTAAGVEDALAASNLASAIIDLEEYGKTHTIRIADAKRAFTVYQEALCCNLKLDEYQNTTNRDFLADRVEIKEYIIYNVKDDVVNMICLDGEGTQTATISGKKGEVYTPDGLCVETTTIYSRIGFWVEGLGEQRIYAEKDKSIDIARCKNE